jgi:hypothetical protein
MILKTRFRRIQLLSCVALVGLVVLLIRPSGAAAIEELRPAEWNDIQMIGVIDPNGKANLWAISISDGAELLGMLTGRPIQVNNGIRFYSVASWKEMADVLTVLNRHQAQVIERLADAVQQLNRRVSLIEKKKRRIVYSGSMNSRLKRLEQKVESMSDGGNP